MEQCWKWSWMLALSLLSTACGKPEIKVEETPRALDGTPQALASQEAPVTALPTDHPSLPPGHPLLSATNGEGIAEASAQEPANAVDMANRTLPASVMSRADNPEWTVPQGWLPGRPSSMRRGSFAVQGNEGTTLDISVTAFPGDVGGLLPNLNRWRGQVGLPPATTEQLPSFTETLRIEAKEAIFADLQGQQDATLAVIMEHQGDSWFIKMMGPKALVAQERARFLTFARSFRFPSP